jgi:regulation of enolase protein 1 (concanavalin A-like superfamily)
LAWAIHDLKEAAGSTSYLQLERRGGTVLMRVSKEGTEWKTVNTTARQLDLPRKLKVGVLVEARAREPFKAVFDQFRLTPLGGETR